MRNSDPFRAAALLLLACSAVDCRADELSLTGDARLSGTVRSIDANGVVELASELSPQPVLLKPDAVEKISFGKAGTQADDPGAMIELVNGDVIPARIESFDGKVLQATTPDAGALAIPRASMKSMQLGVHRQKVIYSGPKALEEWTSDSDGAKNWRFEKGVLTATGPAIAVRKVAVPPRFILKFRLKWQTSPNFTVYFADPLTSGVDQPDRYFLQFNASGIEVKRESETGRKPQTVILLNRSPDEFPSNEIAVEIRVDRTTSRLHLLLNGEPEAAGVDPVSSPPMGTGFVFASNSPGGNNQEIRGIEILDFDNTRERHRTEDRGDTATDSLISREDDRWGGDLTSIANGADGKVLTFRSDFQEEPLELLESDVSTVFFAKPESEAPPEKQVPWILKLKGDGSLHVTSCSFSETSVNAAHPLLGDLEIKRAGVTALERIRPDRKEEDGE